MKTIILAAGKSTRLLPLTKDIPQSMLKVGERSILEWQLENLKKAGIDKITVVVGYLSRKLEKFCQTLGIKTLFNPFYDVSGTAISLWIAKEELKNGFVFLYSDVLFDSAIIKELLKSKKDICLAVKKNGIREEAERIVEKEGIIKNIGKAELTGADAEFIGIAKFSDLGASRIIKELENTAKNDLDASFIKVIDNLIGKGEIIVAHDIKDAQFIDIDFPKDLTKAEKLW